MLRVLGVLNLALMSCRIVPVANSTGLTADAELAAGMAAHEKGDLRAALQHAQKAVALAPKITKAHFALGLTADDMCIPNAEPGPDERLCGLAIQEYKMVLELDASHEDALKNLAYLLYQFDRVDESESYYRRDLALHADDPEVLGAVAAIDYRRSFTDLAKTKLRLNRTPKTPLIQTRSCSEVRDRNQARVEEGIALVMRALQVRKSNSDLRRYLSVLYSIRAEIQCGNWPAYQADMKAAREWDRTRKENTGEREVQADVLRKCPPAPPPISDDE